LNSDVGWLGRDEAALLCAHLSSSFSFFSFSSSFSPSFPPSFASFSPSFSASPSMICYGENKKLSSGLGSTILCEKLLMRKYSWEFYIQKYFEQKIRKKSKKNVKATREVIF